MKKNLFIAFCGMDGSGKSTLAKKTAHYLQKKAFHVYLKHAHGYAISQNSFGIDVNMIIGLKWLFTILSPLTVLDSFFTYYFKFKPILKNNTLICDRYFYDKIARLIYYGIINIPIAQIYLRFLPKPDYIFFLDIEEEKALKRKSEYTKDQMTIFKKAYLFIANYLGAPLIKTGDSLVTTKKKIFSHFNNL